VRPRVPGVSDRAGSRRALRWRYVECGLPPTSTASAPRCKHRFRGSIPGPHVPLSTLRRTALPPPTHDSGPLWVAIPSTSWTFTYLHRAGFDRRTEDVMTSVDTETVKILRSSAATSAAERIGKSTDSRR
jgi:hypothetical protein